ncbi:MAG TPA: sigma-70 family RNA polymerase sigma factor [Lacipirellulaceae bacterium]|jgi:RNA polymerase sigma-70 factor (ECF subfamily)|nr:sigma-70 family RNA polymerase sigma factor [Lacipirellulaceae bacterium]
MSTSDLDWLTQVVTERAAGLKLFARQWVDPATAEDVVQEALVALLAERQPPRSPVAWMYRAVRNAAFDHHRASTRRRKREQVVAAARGAWFEQQSNALLDAWEVESALQSLGGESRQLVVMRIWGELGFAEIASVLELSVSTVHDRYKKALCELRSALEQPCPKKMN